MKSSTSFPRPIINGLLLILVLAVAYIFVYQQAPFPDPWTDIFLNLAIVLPAMLAAYLASRIYGSFQADEGPRRVWKWFALGLWNWAVAEAVWLVIWLQRGEVPTPSLSEPFWLLGLPCFAMAFLLQYRLIFFTSREQEIRWLGLALALVLVLTIAGTQLLRSTPDVEMTWWQTFLEVFYVAADAAMMAAALGLARLFGRGMWGRAWWGLLAFVLSDALYSYIQVTGLYAQSAESSNLLSLTADCVYAVAYMLMALACWSQLLLVRYGPSLVPQAETN